MTHHDSLIKGKGSHGGILDGPLYFTSPDFEPLYTILLMVPDGFLDFGAPGERMRTQNYILCNETTIEAEMICISLELGKIVKKWTTLDEYLSTLLSADCLTPKEFVKSLFNDENFSLSRKYFWAIGFLGELDISIRDNIKLRDMYCEGGVK